MRKTGTWKSNLLSSGLMLEFEAARALRSRNCFVKADYAYSRIAEGMAKDFSVDIRSTTFVPWTPASQPKACLTLLIECKYRHPGKEWLFLPALDTTMFSPYGPGRAIRVLDEFSPYEVDLDPAAFFDHELAQCYKGTEVDCESGAVHGDELRHGIEQLRYLLPRLVTEEVVYAMGKPEDNAPFALCPILLTTAQLRVLDKETSIEQVIRADSLEKLGTSASFLLLYSDYGPDFAAHCETVCNLLGTLPAQKLNVPDPEMPGEGAYTAASSEFERVNAVCRGLASADPAVLSRYFTQFVICNHDAFPQLVDKVVGTTAQILGVAKVRGGST